MLGGEEAALSDEERLEGINSVLERLRSLSADHVILVEGVNDRRALVALGVRGDYFMMQCSGGPVRAVEYVEGHGGRAVVMTDWDRRGDNLAQTIRRLTAGSNDVDFSVRGDIFHLCARYVRDVESLDSLVRRLSTQ